MDDHVGVPFHPKKMLDILTKDNYLAAKIIKGFERGHTQRSKDRRDTWNRIAKSITGQYEDLQQFFGPSTQDVLQRTPLMLALGVYLLDPPRFYVVDDVSSYSESKQERKARFAVIGKLLKSRHVKDNIGAKDNRGKTALGYANAVLETMVSQTEIIKAYGRFHSKIRKAKTKIGENQDLETEKTLDQCCNWCCSEEVQHKCGACLSVKYCSEECQQDDWEYGNHCEECESE